MIWLLGSILAVFTALLLAAPLLPARDKNTKIMISVFMLLFVGAALGIYQMIGSPKLSDPANLIAESEATPPDIEAMVNGLAERLKEAPNDPEGWTRLIRSRIVLGDITAAIEDHKAMRQIFADQPELVAQISARSGFDTMAQDLLSEQTPDQP